MMIPTMRKLFGLCFSLSIALSAHAVLSAPLVLHCPVRYPDDKNLLKMRNNGWYAPSAGVAGSALNQTGALTGPAEQNAELRGSDLSNESGRQFNFYGTEADGEKWVFCNYDNGRLYLRLMYAIPVETKRCETNERRTRGRLVAASIRCD
jgi:hypothetical protein